jgi:hypothetical protein
MRENRTYGSEGGGTETNRFSLPLSVTCTINFRSIPKLKTTIFMTCDGELLN